MSKLKKNKKDIQFEQPSDILLLVNRYLMFIVAFIIVAISLFGYFFVLKPKIENINITEERTVATEDRREANERLLSRIEELEAEYYDIINNRQEDLDFLKRMVPEDTQMPEIFLMADILAKRHGFTLMNVNINDIPRNQSRSQSRNSQNQAQTEEGDVDVVGNIDDLLTESGIQSATLKFSISKEVSEGSDITGQEIYTDFKNYLSDLENNMRLLDVQSMLFRSVDAEPAADGENTYTFDLDLITYYK